MHRYEVNAEMVCAGFSSWCWVLDVKIVVTSVRGIVIHGCNIRVFELEMRAQGLYRATQQWTLRLLDKYILRSSVSTFGRSVHLR